MINVKAPKPIFLENEGAQSAVLLLHSFTGTVRDVKLLASKLHKEGYTCLIPPYRGHGLLLPELMQYDTDDWWEDVCAAFQQLVDLGYQKIHVVGVSLGGLYALKLAEQRDVTSVVVMSTPYKKGEVGLTDRLVNYGERMGVVLGLSSDEVDTQLQGVAQYKDKMQRFQAMIEDIMGNLDRIRAPIAIKYGKKDEAAYEASAQFIYDHIAHEHKFIKGYPESKHLMTQGSGHAEVEADVKAFLQNL